MLALFEFYNYSNLHVANAVIESALKIQNKGNCKFTYHRIDRIAKLNLKYYERDRNIAWRYRGWREVVVHVAVYKHYRIKIYHGIAIGLRWRCYCCKQRQLFCKGWLVLVILNWRKCNWVLTRPWGKHGIFGALLPTRGPLGQPLGPPAFQLR